MLAIQDTSAIPFRTTDERRRGLGVIAKGVGRGLLLHPMIAVDADSGECLGLVGGSLWTRAEADPARGQTSTRQRKNENRRRPRCDKESRHWIATPQAAKPVLAAAARVTMIADREAAIYQLWALVPEGAVHGLGRLYQDRPLAGGGRLMTAAQHWPGLGRRRLSLREREGRLAREAQLEVRAGAVTLTRPADAGEPGLPKRLTLRVIKLSKPDPPAGAKAFTWRLLTTHPTPDAASAWQIVEWYRRRRGIEQFFRILKRQGLQIEDSQVESAERLIKLRAIAARAAVIILQLTQTRDGASRVAAPLVFSPAEIATLDAVNTSCKKPRSNPHPRLSLAWAAWVIARLGGWHGRASPRPPGPITFKYGLVVTQFEIWIAVVRPSTARFARAQDEEFS